MNDIESIKKYVRAANYLSVTQIYLQDNFLLKRSLVSEDIKPRLFGHWGTCPGINFLYGSLNYFANKNNVPMLFILGPGHGLPALQANLFLDGTLGKYYPEARHDLGGLSFVSKNFSWPYGFSSHSNPEIPGVILEGGELGYSLATAYGTVLDHPKLLAVCMIGDGEAETGPISSAWNINKIVNPATNGSVLPVLHLNRYKISGPTIFGRMKDEDLVSLFRGYGYEPTYVRGENIYEDTVRILEKSYADILDIKKAARERGEIKKHPLIILDTPKGWSTLSELRGKKIEGTINSHQVVVPNARHDEEELAELENWLKSYNFNELFDEKNGFIKEIMDIIPNETFRIGDSKYIHSNFKDLKLPESSGFDLELGAPGIHQSNSMRLAGDYFRKLFKENEDDKNFRLFSPDETYSNRLDSVFEVTSRAFALPIKEHDLHLDPDGRVMEMLSEHNLHGISQGYILTGRHAVFSTYEAFAQIVSSMAHQYIKFIKISRETPFRNDVSSMNYLLSSVVWRQEHNGYSHQNPSFISGMLEKNNCFVNAYFPADDSSMLAVLDEVLSSKNQVNTVVAGKSPEPRWVSLELAKDALKDGMLIWDFASDNDPDLVFLGIGDYMTKECLAAIELLKKQLPDIKIRFVNGVKLHGKCSCKDEFHPQLPNAVDYLTEDKPVIVNFHGYPEVVKSILFDLGNSERFTVNGYKEHGATTTPFDMLVRNKTDRFNLATQALSVLEKRGVISSEEKDEISSKFEEMINNHKAYITVHGKDPSEIENWQWGHEPLGDYDPAEIEKASILKRSKTIAIIGLSDKSERHSYRVASFLRDKGYKIIPVNPNVDEVFGEKSYQSLLEIPKDIEIDIVDIFRKPEEVVSHMKEVMIRGGIKTVWLAEGTSSVAAEEYAMDYGLTLVSNFCILEAYNKLSS